MTKRFTLEEFGDRCVAHDNGRVMDARQVVEFLNVYEDENEQLKSEIEKLSYANEDLLEEKRIWKQMSDEYTKLSDENEQLKAYKQKVAKVFKVAIKETTLTEQTENSLQTISKILEVDLE